MVSATDSQLGVYQLTVLADDKHLFPYYAPAATVRQDFLTKNPDVLNLVNPVASLLTDAVMSELNRQVDYDMRTPTDVATAFLKAHSLLH